MTTTATDTTTEHCTRCTGLGHQPHQEGDPPCDACAGTGFVRSPARLTPAQVREALADLVLIAARDDDEIAHVEEDRLYVRVLRAIADDRCESPAECARLALASDRIGFNRRCA